MSNDVPAVGCYFHPRDCVGLGGRFVILAIDFLAALTIVILIPPVAGPFVTLVGVWIYLVVLNATPFRTLGYRLVGARVVTLNGQSVNVFQLSYRMLITMLGIGNPLLDLCWMDLDRNRQTLRDKLAGTYVIRMNAEPAGRGTIQQSRIFAAGYTFVYQKVTITEPPNA